MQSGFDSGMWRRERGKYDGENARMGMVTDLRNCHLQEGMSRASIELLLGKPDVVEGSSATYFLGDSEYGIDSESLIIVYDFQDKLSKTHIHRD